MRRDSHGNNSSLIAALLMHQVMLILVVGLGLAVLVLAGWVP